MASKYQHQQLLEKLFSKNQLLPRIKEVFESFPEFTKMMDAQGIDPAFGHDVLVQMALRKRADLPTMVGMLRHHFEDGQKTADHLLKCVEADLLDWNEDLEVFIVKFLLPQPIQEELDRFQFPLPMVIVPRQVTHNRENGYLFNHRSIILKNNHHELDVCLDHINRVNKVKLTLNYGTAAMVKNKWKGLDKKKVDETFDEFKARKKAFEKYDRTAREVIGLLVQEGNEFYLTHRYDKRGRVYCQGYHVNYQGNAWNKSCIEFADKEYID